MPDNSLMNQTIEDILLQNGKITQEQYNAIKIQSANLNQSIRDVIKNGNFVNDNEYALAFSKAYNVEYISLKGKKIDPTLYDILPVDFVRKYQAVPFSKTSEIVQVAMTDPLNLEVIEFIERKSGLKVISYITTSQDVNDALEEAKTKTLTEDVSKALQEISTISGALKIDGSGTLTKDDATIKDAPVARIVGMIVETAVKVGASDIHLESSEKNIRLRYRIDGVLEERRTFPKEMSDSIVARIKILSGLKIDEKRIPQDGRFKVQVGDVFTDLRVSTLPTVYGEKVVIRLLKAESTIYTFQQLGMRGLTLVEGVNQVQVNIPAGLTFASALRSFLRQDPNIIMVGEIRDEETANLAIQAALTGHLVLSTLHTNSAAGAIPRLLDMNVENYLLSSTCNGVLAQRLIRKLCSNCRQEYDAPEDMKIMIRNSLKEIESSSVLESKDKGVYESAKKVENADFKLYRPVGCDKCNNLGYKGRVGIFEFMQISPEIARATLEKKSSQEIEQIAKQQGMITLIQDGFLKCVDGTTNVSEVLRVALE